VPDHVTLVARKSQELEAATQLVVVPYHCLGLEGVADIGQLQFDRNPFSRLKFGSENHRDTALADVERAAGNASGKAGT
jgi:hypothetical protein